MKIASSSSCCRGGACVSLLLWTAFFLGPVVGSLTNDRTSSLEDCCSFEWFVEKFGRVYDSSEQHQHRQHVFESNLRRVMEHNQDPTNTYQLGINHFMDLEHHELPFGYDKALHHRHNNNSNNKNWLQDDNLSTTTKRSLHEVSNYKTTPFVHHKRARLVLSCLFFFLFYNSHTHTHTLVSPFSVWLVCVFLVQQGGEYALCVGSRVGIAIECGLA